MTALFKLTKASAKPGLICMVKTEFGQKPKVSLKNLTNSLTSLDSIFFCGSTRGIRRLYNNGRPDWT